MKFRHKPTVVDAFQFTNSDVGLPDWLPTGWITISSHYPDGKIRLQIYSQTVYLQVEIGDWVIKGENGNISTCTSDVFHLVYEPESSRTPL